MKFFKSVNFLLTVIAMTLCIGSIVSANPLAPSDGGSHAGAVGPYSKIQMLADDAANFRVVGIKAIKVPTQATVTGQPCLSSDEYAQNCEQIHYGNYIPAYRLTLSYVSKQTKMSDGLENDVWETSFVLKRDELNPTLVADVLSKEGKDKKAALQTLLKGVNRIKVAREGYVVTKSCEYNLVGETEFRKVDPNCNDVVAKRTFYDTAFEIVPAK